jgi:transcriptional regulator with XRE-family HTH domain
LNRAEYHACLRALGWSARELARQLGRNPDTVGNWCKAKHGYSVPVDVAEWLRDLVTVMDDWREKNPPPRR